MPIRYGIAKYATEAEVIMAQWAIDDGPVTVHSLADGPPAALVDAARQAAEIWAHGAEFERQLLRYAAWWPEDEIPATRWRCTMALCRMHGLPGGLDKLSTIFRLDANEAKDKRGYELIQLFCVPGKDSVYADRASHPKEWAEFCEYGAMDVTAMRAVWRKCPKWNATPRVWAIWHLDQRMNARGVAVDLKLAAGAVSATDRAKKRLAARTQELTENTVQATTQRDRLLAYMADYGVSLPDLKADTVERRLEDESLPEHIKELLRVRQQASKSSSAKYKRALVQHVGGRLRNLLVFCGATRTGRWAGRTLQPQNFPRPKYPQWDIDHAIKRFAEGTADSYAPEEIMGLAASCLRGLIVAGPGRRLVVSDLANIEGRYMAWVAGEQWKLEAFAAYDRQEGPDLYKVSAGRMLGKRPEDIADDSGERQLGKVCELALQYYGGVGAFCAMAETYGLRLEELPETAWPNVPADFRKEARQAWARATKRHKTYGLAESVWVTCHALVLMWRAAHPAIVKFWDDLDRATKIATRVPGRKVRVGGHITVDRVENWLRIRLPSGRYLSYPAPQSDDYTSSFLGVDPYTKQWKRLSTYSGKRAENIVQGGSADILMDGLLAADEAGYSPVLSVHDEALCEPPDSDEFTDRKLSALLAQSSLWADGLPLSAKGFTSARYRK